MVTEVRDPSNLLAIEGQECSAKKTQTLHVSDKTTVLQNTAKEIQSSVYGAFKYIIIVKNISLNNHNETTVWSTGLAHCNGVEVTEVIPSLQLLATNLQFLHLPFQPHSLH